jgi:hypothetical protein
MESAVNERATHLLGVRDGLAHALVSIGRLRQGITGPGGCYLPPERHTRRRHEVFLRLAALDNARDAIQQQLNDVKLAYEAAEAERDALRETLREIANQ